MIGTILRSTGSFKGKRRLARLFLKNKIATLQDVIVKASYGCAYKLPNIKEDVGFDIYIDGVFEKETIELILEHLPPNAILVDMGANVGAISLPVCMQRKDIKAICIEASPRVYKYLEFNIAYNQAENCTAINKAIMDTDGQTVNFYSPVDKFGKGSMSSLFTKEAELVDTISLDTLLEQKGIEKIDFIKVDIEGYEYYGFKGAKKLLSKANAPDILFEFIDIIEESANGIKAGSAQQLLLDYGYRLFSLTNNKKKKILLAPQTVGNAMIFATKK
ncbi:MAG: FkbM family methyltransferase [Ferruginibacter sp.]